MRSIGSVKGVQKAHVVDTLCDVWEQFTDVMAALSVLLEFPWRAEQVAGIGELYAWLVEGKRFAMILLKLRLVFEGVDMRWPALHE